jgi:hypothetical protein
MNRRLLYVMLLTLLLGLMWTSALNPALCATSSDVENLERSFSFDVQYGHFPSTHSLYVSIPESLYSYYSSLSHSFIGDGDYAKYVTPSIFKSIAENIQKTTNNTPYSDEQFANAVLSLVRQIPYNKSNVKYPIETLVENSGDCDVLSLLAASIMEAGGLDVVLFHYIDLNPSHMNIGVCLDHKPVYRSWWITPTSFDYDNKTYWVAETTSLGQWKVGVQPELLANCKPYIIPINVTQKSVPGIVSSSLDTPLLPSNISITLSSDNITQNENKHFLNVSGVITPALPNQTVTMYLTHNTVIQTFQTTTDQNGNYSFNWGLTTTSTYQIQTSCSSIPDCRTADSDVITVFGSSPPDSGYILGDSNGNLAAYASSLNQGAKEFLKGNVSGTGASLSGEFILLDSNIPEPTNETVTVTHVLHLFSLGRGRMIHPYDVTIEEKIAPPVTPIGQVGFILQQDSNDNYTASVKVLGDQDVSQISTQINNENTAFMNVSRLTQNNIWYRINATMSANGTDATIYQENGTLLNNVSPSSESATSNQVGVVLAYSSGAVIAFRNLKVESLDKPETPAVSASSIGKQTTSGPPYIEILVTLGVVFAVATLALASVRRKRHTRQPKLDAGPAEITSMKNS